MSSLLSLKDEGQRSDNEFCSCITDNQTAVQWHSAITEVLAAFLGKTDIDDIATTSRKWGSKKCQYFSLYHPG